MKKAPAPPKTKSVKALKGIIRKPDKPISIEDMRPILDQGVSTKNTTEGGDRENAKKPPVAGSL
jgi:hypothetical protein